MHATGGQKLIRRPDHMAFSKNYNKRPESSRNRDVYDPDNVRANPETMMIVGGERRAKRPTSASERAYGVEQSLVA